MTPTAELVAVCKRVADEQPLFREETIRLLREAAERLEQDAKDAEQWERDLLRATSTGMATIIARFPLTPYLQDKYDELARLHAKCDKAFAANLDAAKAGR